MAFVKPTVQAPSCPTCGTNMLLKEKEGSKFWGCPNWREAGCKTLRYQDPTPTPKAPQRPYNKSTEADIPVVKESSDNGIIQLITNLASRIDMAVENLGRIETRFNELNDKLDGLKADLGLIINEIIPKVE